MADRKNVPKKEKTTLFESETSSLNIFVEEVELAADRLTPLCERMSSYF